MKSMPTKFMKGLVTDDEILADGTPQIAFVGRSNVGKSTLINVLTGSSISRTSAFAGRTQEINVFLVDNKYYLVDLPGYGFARASGMAREKIWELIYSYLFNSIHPQKLIVLIIDANVGITDKDITMLEELETHKKNYIIVANKIDKMTQSEYHHKMKEINRVAEGCVVIPFSSKKREGLDQLIEEIFK